jgi:FtsP/CotA-like multicopper oxidase with cupredoxin domain
MRHRWLPASWSIAVALSWIPTASGHTVASPTPRLLEQIAVNDNRVSAGALQNGVLTIRLDARVGEWHPDGDADAGITVRAFGEEGKPLQIPGPLIRVPKGTEIHAFVRNSLDSTLYVHGLYMRGAPGGDTVQIAAGSVREVRFNAGRARDLLLLGHDDRDSDARQPGMDSQLHGVFVVDAGAALGTPRDRIFVLGLWSPAPSRASSSGTCSCGS